MPKTGSPREASALSPQELIWPPQWQFHCNLNALGKGGHLRWTHPPGKVTSVGHQAVAVEVRDDESEIPRGSRRDEAKAEERLSGDIPTQSCCYDALRARALIHIMGEGVWCPGTPRDAPSLGSPHLVRRAEVPPNVLRTWPTRAPQAQPRAVLCPAQ